MADSDKSLETLFDGLRPRPEPPDAARERAFLAAAEELRALRSRRRRHTYAALAMAAGLVLALSVGLLNDPADTRFSVELAQASALRVDGRQVDADGGVELPVQTGTLMQAGAPARLVLSSGLDLRLNADTSIRWRDAQEIELVEGAVFIDTNETGAMQVHTERGRVTDIGTQFLVSYADDVLEVAVRTGRALVESASGHFEAGADGFHGDVIRLSDAGVATSVEPTDAGRWTWISAVPRGYEEARVALLLRQIALDLGRRVVYADRGSEARVSNLTLRGERLDGMTAEQALRVVAAAADLEIALAPQRELRVAVP